MEQLLQQRSVRIMLEMKSTGSVKNSFPELGILTVYGLVILETVYYVKQFSNSTSQNSLHTCNSAKS